MALAASDLRLLRGSLHDEVTARLRDLVIDGCLLPGQRLNERILCDQLAVSRTPLREAMKVLAAEGLLELLPNRGAIVARLSVEELDHTIEVMGALEHLAGMLVPARLTAERLGEIKALHYEMLAHHARGDLPGYFRCNQAIHFAIMAATLNPVLERQYGQLNAQVRRYRYMANLSRERWDQSVEEHELILRHLIARAPEALADILTRHLENKIAHLKLQLIPSPERAPGSTLRTMPGSALR
jgi:DNA-binding GntR family transcriptional regulator